MRRDEEGVTLSDGFTDRRNQLGFQHITIREYVAIEIFKGNINLLRSGSRPGLELWVQWIHESLALADLFLDQAEK